MLESPPMNAYHKKQKLKKRKSIFRKWHRRLGFAASLFLFNLAITGLLLNHYEGLALHTKYLSSEPLLSLYQIKAPKTASCFGDNLQKACQIGRFIYINQSFIQESESNLRLFTALKQQTILVSDKSLQVFTPELKLIDEVIHEDFFQSPVQHWSIHNGQLIAQLHKNVDDYLNEPLYLFDFELFEWNKLDGATLNLNQSNQKVTTLSTEQPVTQAELSALQSLYRQQQITLLRFVQDLHSGRILGFSGQTTNDITAIILLLLAISGFVTWQRRKNIPQDSS